LLPSAELGLESIAKVASDPLVESIGVVRSELEFNELLVMALAAVPVLVVLIELVPLTLDGDGVRLDARTGVVANVDGLPAGEMAEPTGIELVDSVDEPNWAVVIFELLDDRPRRFS